MKTNKTFLPAAVLLGIMFLAGGCNDLKLKGRQVTFTTVAGEVGTKTAYGDNYPESGTTTWQYIDWVTGDHIQIVSNNAANQAGRHSADYRISELLGRSGHQSMANVEPTPNGLTWGEAQKYDFYAVYPTPGTGAVDAIYSPDDLNSDNAAMLGTVRVILPYNPTPTGNTKKYLTATGTATTEGAENIAYTYDVYEPDMKYAVMTAAATDVDKDGETDVSLLFKPAFTAFEFNLTSADENFTVNKVELFSAEDYLAGTYVLKAGAELSNGSVQTSGTSNSQYLTMTVNHALTPNSGFTFTFFTIPIQNTGTLGLRVVTSSGTAILNLTDTDKTSAYKFEPGKKYRINLLKLGGTWKYKINLDPNARPWDLVEESTTFSQNIQATPFDIKNAKETGNNYYPAGTKDYQVRTLDIDNGKTFFEVTFKPSAPLGGYWQLIPESNGGLGAAAFKVEVWDDKDNIGSSDLKGQIMNQPVTLHITSIVTDDQRTEDHAIIIKSIFSTSATFDENSTFSADSEIQDVHRDGSFSYWRFVIPAKNN